MMTAAIANGGTLFEPKVVHAFQNPVTGVTREHESKVIRDSFVEKGNLQIIRQGMRECVVYGSCRLLSGLPINVAGKTGTAQWSSTKENHAWFTSFAPYEKPEIVLTILVEEGVGGDKIAVPIANDFYKWWQANK
jgi:penicillin-binding protein 2